ncbi:entry exclusion lipoprotein TrbK [Bartonella sp. F02]|uniref:entry exclusion lipoprotein TrbK n=1 Tax=Bartonella sp. F02 TaxID=2967262 RepID=UPI0022A9DFB7|nr:entry exclusion lipoprotein TrbK [Bartonella sp. F02]MCZ2328949.1 entry exclusion lipoprotein TrbK [Bartonella sp. F02]
MTKKLFIFTTAILMTAALVGCGEEERPYPNEENCSPGVFQKEFKKLKSKRNRDAYKAECDAFNAHKAMLEWNSKPVKNKDWSRAPF